MNNSMQCKFEYIVNKLYFRFFIFQNFGKFRLYKKKKRKSSSYKAKHKHTWNNFDLVLHKNLLEKFLLVSMDIFFVRVLCDFLRTYVPFYQTIRDIFIFSPLLVAVRRR